MPRLTVAIDDAVWPEVLETLTVKFGPVPAGVQPVVWASGILADSFRVTLADALAPPARERRTRRRIHPSMIHP